MNTAVLEAIHSPADVKALDGRGLENLARDIRTTIIRTVATTGGHLATNLGTVELSLALHVVLTSPGDRIIWDVGNQCYTHKLVTGRRERFSKIRTSGGVSGFVNRGESAHDHLTAGHAGTALSSALGIATGRDHLQQEYVVAAVVGDGALTAGMSFEALNNLATLKSQLLVVFNDNDFSISRSSGALAQTFQAAKTKICDGSIFEQLGITYLGPVDGHDLRLMTSVLSDAIQMPRPVVLHVITQKGKGYQPAEADPQRFHGVSPFDPETGEPAQKSKATTYSTRFGAELCRLAEHDKKIMAITAAMTAGTGLAEFAQRFREQFFDVGIAEQHAVTFAAGLAVAGCHPVVAIYSSFLQRGYDQVIHDTCLQNLPVTFVMDRAGIVGADGPTHHGIFDIGYLRMLPRMVVMAPKDGRELGLMLEAAVAHDGPTAIRIPRGQIPPEEEDGNSSTIAIGRGELLRSGSDIGLIAIGSMVGTALEVAESLEARGFSVAVINARFAKPLDETLLCSVAENTKRLYTLEEHAGLGGFGSAVVELLAKRSIANPVAILGLPDRFIEHGSTDELLDSCGLSTNKIVSRILDESAGSFGSRDLPPVIADPEKVNQAIAAIRQRSLPNDLQRWIEKYDQVGHREGFLWRWSLKGVELTTLPCVDEHLRDINNVTKVLGVMWDVLLDDVADQSGDKRFLEQLLAIPFDHSPAGLDPLPSEQRDYANTAAELWETIVHRAKGYPRHAEFQELLFYDYRQLLNTMRYSALVNGEPLLLNLTEHDLYLPHNMHMMISGTLDLMCSPSFDSSELGAFREVLWHAQCMGRVGNLLTTWERELKESDLTSGVFAYALQIGAATPESLRCGDKERSRDAIRNSGCERFFLDRWKEHRAQIESRIAHVESVDLRQLVAGLERLFAIHMGSRGLK